MTSPCFYCGASPYAGCRHQEQIARPHRPQVQAVDGTERTDLRQFHNAWARLDIEKRKNGATGLVNSLKDMLQPRHR